jgi:raffinose/stachyose/melibiose transport system permease protein
MLEFTNARRVSRTATATLIALLFLIPILYVIMISFESPSHFLTHPLRPPTSPVAGNYSQAYHQGDLGPELVNTIVYSLAAAGISTFLSVLIAFPVARGLVRWSSWIYRSFVIGICLPLAVIPLFVEARDLHLYNNRLGYILLHVEPGLPLGVLLIAAFISSVPGELDEAAWLDGCSYARYILQFVIRLAWPSVLITFLYSLLQVWNDIIGPLIFLSSPNLLPVTRGIYNFYGQNESAWTLLAAAVVIVSLPVIALFAASQKQLLRSAVGGST